MHAFICPKCGAKLGDTDGVTLRLKGVSVTSRAHIQCQACGEYRTWRPVQKAQPAQWQRALVPTEG